MYNVEILKSGSRLTDEYVTFVSGLDHYAEAARIVGALLDERLVRDARVVTSS